MPIFFGLQKTFIATPTRVTVVTISHSSAVESLIQTPMGQKCPLCEVSSFQKGVAILGSKSILFFREVSSILAGVLIEVKTRCTPS